MPIYNWDSEKETIVDRLGSQATLKLAVKLVDEPLLVRDWIEHHAKIVGFENLIVADNGSTDETTLDIYREYSDRVTIFRFDGPHNQIHWHPRFLELFQSIRRSSSYFSFIDIDERLIFIDGNSWLADDSIVQKLERAPASGIIPTTWLMNTLNSFDSFSFLDSEDREVFENNLRWGKPIMPAFLAGIQAGIHNAQFDRFEFSTRFGCHFFLLHLTRFPERRIAASRNKIISRGVVHKGTPTHEIISMNFDGHPDKTLSRFVGDMKKMIAILENESEHADFGERGMILLDSAGSIRFSKDSGWKFISDFMTDGPRTIRRLFGGEDDEEGLSKDANALLALALECRNKGPQSRAEILFRRGMAIYPEFMDRFGHPAFRKELLRMLLARGDWKQANDLAPVAGDPGGNSWHKTLFARAHSQRGDKEKASFWWKQVLSNDPSNEEAKSYIEGRLNTQPRQTDT